MMEYSLLKDEGVMPENNLIKICQIVLVIFFLFVFVEVGFSYDAIKNLPVPNGYERIRYDKKVIAITFKACL